MPKPMPSWNRPSPSDSAPVAGGPAFAARQAAPSVTPVAAHAAASRLGQPIAKLGSSVPIPGPSGMGREVLVSMDRAPLGLRVFLESLPSGGPIERIQAFALPAEPNSAVRHFRGIVPAWQPGSPKLYLPVAVLNGEEVRGERFLLSDPSADLRPARALGPSDRGPTLAAPGAAPSALPFPTMTLLAHVEADLPSATLFGATPEGVRIAFYIADGHWHGPRINARYKAEGGDWLVVRRDGIAIPNVRATLETSDGALLYYELTGTIDLGPAGYERSLVGDLSAVAPFSAVARVSTSSERWQWLNRLTLVGAGVVNLKSRRAHYDLYSIQCDPEALSTGP